MEKPISFSKGMGYPWGNASRLWNILWGLIPILGILALIGYFQKIAQALAKKDFKGLPQFGKFWDNTSKGFVLFIKYLPLAVVLWIISSVPVIGKLASTIISIFILPWLVINFFVKDDFAALWEVKKAVNIVSKNLQDYVISFLKQFAYWIIYGIASIILIGIPCNVLGGYVFIVDFYNRHKK